MRGMDPVDGMTERVVFFFTALFLFTLFFAVMITSSFVYSPVFLLSDDKGKILSLDGATPYHRLDNVTTQLNCEPAHGRNLLYATTRVEGPLLTSLLP